MGEIIHLFMPCSVMLISTITFNTNNHPAMIKEAAARKRGSSAWWRLFFIFFFTINSVVERSYKWESKRKNSLVTDSVSLNGEMMKVFSCITISSFFLAFLFFLQSPFISCHSSCLFLLLYFFPFLLLYLFLYSLYPSFYFFFLLYFFFSFS